MLHAIAQLRSLMSALLLLVFVLGVPRPLFGWQEGGRGPDHSPGCPQPATFHADSLYRKTAGLPTHAGAPERGCSAGRSGVPRRFAEELKC